MPDKMYAGVKSLIEREGEILFVKIDVYDEIIYALPGGRVDYGENPREALVRETEEETSLEIKPVEPVGMYHFFTGKDSDGEQVVLTVWDVEWFGDVSTDTNHAEEDSIVGYEWVDPERLGKINAAPELKRLIKRAFRTKLDYDQ